MQLGKTDGLEVNRQQRLIPTTIESTNIFSKISPTIEVRDAKTLKAQLWA